MQKDKTNKKILITGITGFVGSHFADYLLAKGMEVHGLIRWRSSKDNIKHCLDKISLYHGDLLDSFSLQSILREIRPDFIFHLAAQSLVPYSFAAPVSTLDINCIGTCNLLESIKLLKILDGYDPVVVVCSSSEVYGQVREEDIPITEDCPLHPASPYAVSKVCEDMLGYQYWVSWGIKIIRSRLFTHTGERQNEIFVVSNFAKQIAEIESGLKEPIVYVGNLDSVRTFMDVKDAVQAYWLLVNKCEHGEVYNIGGDTTMTIGDMLNKLLELSTEKGIIIKTDPTRLRPSDVTLQIPNYKKFTLATGWIPSIPFNETLKEILNYWRCILNKKYSFIKERQKIPYVFSVGDELPHIRG